MGTQAAVPVALLGCLMDVLTRVLIRFKKGLSRFLHWGFIKWVAFVGVPVADLWVGLPGRVCR